MGTARMAVRSQVSPRHPSAAAGDDRVQMVAAWQSAIDSYGSSWRPGETLRPQPWQEREGESGLEDHPSAPQQVGEDPELVPGDPVEQADETISTRRHHAHACCSTSTREEVATVLGPRYQPEYCVGLGGMGEVWRAIQRPLRRVVAVKVLPSGLTSELIARAFRAEALIASHLDHPNIIPVYDAGERFLAMKFIEGRSLADLIDEAPGVAGIGRLPRLIEILIKVCEAMAFAHDHGVIHCDLKPQNVMLGEHGEVTVMDWGLAACVSGVDDPELRHLVGRHAGRCAGTPGYMAPEMARRRPDINTPCDVFLLGGMLFEILAGEMPFPAETPLAAIMRSADHECEQVLDHNPFAPQRLIEAMAAAMDPQPAERPSVSAFAEQLRVWLRSSGNEEQARTAREQAHALLAGTVGLSSRYDWDRIYDLYAGAVHEIDRALTLDPEDHDTRALRESAIQRFKLAAVSAGELFLARLLARGTLPPRQPRREERRRRIPKNKEEGSPK